MNKQHKPTFSCSVDALIAFHKITESVRLALRNGTPLTDEQHGTLTSISGYLDVESMCLASSELATILWKVVDNHQWPPEKDELQGALWILREQLCLIARCDFASDEANFYLLEAEASKKSKRGRKAA